LVYLGKKCQCVLNTDVNVNMFMFSNNDDGCNDA